MTIDHTVGDQGNELQSASADTHFGAVPMDDAQTNDADAQVLNAYAHHVAEDDVPFDHGAQRIDDPVITWDGDDATVRAELDFFECEMLHRYCRGPDHLENAFIADVIRAKKRFFYEVYLGPPEFRRDHGDDVSREAGE